MDDEYEDGDDFATKIRQAARSGDTSFVRRQLDNCLLLDPDLVDKVFLAAADGGHVHTLQLLLDNGTHVNTTRDANGNSALHRAVSAGHMDAVAFLIRQGACVNQANEKHGDTPIQVACCYGNAELVKLLLKHGANLDIGNRFHETPLHTATEYGYETLVEIILQHETDIDRTNNVGETALHMACAYGDVHTVSMLTSMGADAGIRCMTGSSPLHELMYWFRSYVPTLSLPYELLLHSIEEHVAEFTTMFRYLMEANAHIDSPDSWYQGALEYLDPFTLFHEHIYLVLEQEAEKRADSVRKQLVGHLLPLPLKCLAGSTIAWWNVPYTSLPVILQKWVELHECKNRVTGETYGPHRTHSWSSAHSEDMLYYLLALKKTDPRQMIARTFHAAMGISEWIRTQWVHITQYFGLYYKLPE